MTSEAETKDAKVLSQDWTILLNHLISRGMPGL